VFDLFATVLAWFYSLIPNYAVAIALLTLTIMVLLTPLTLKGTKGMLELQRIQPEMKKIQQQYRGDRQKMNEEMMKLYQEHKVNPLGGCLPLLIQAPVFIILYQVLIGLTRRCTPGLLADGACTTVGNFAPKYLDKSTDMFQDLVGSNEMLSFGLDLSQKAMDVVREDFVRGLPYLALVLIVAVLSYVQQWQITARNKDQPANPQQKILLRVLPGFFAVISLTLPSGIIFYFLVSNLYRILQQAYITRRFYRNRPSPVGVIDTTEVDAPSAGAKATGSKTSGPKTSGQKGSGAAPGAPKRTQSKQAPAARPAPSARRPAPKKPAARPAPPARPKPQPKKKP
jgi:YidC/Oxa1 family membrane protein insertase